MNTTQIINRNYETMAWGGIFVWWGITELVVYLPNGLDALGIGVILLGLNLARARNGIPTSGFSITLGILAVVWGMLDLAGSLLALPFELPVFAILLIALGLILLVPAFSSREGKTE